ncbi:MAG: M20 family metallopeptidase [Clostridia bacterium]
MFNESVKRIKDKAIEWRRHFHQYPELGMREFKTVEFIENILSENNIDYQKMDFPGIVATIKGGKDGKVIGLRADMDALPMQEETNLPYASKIDGIMHSCGHDIHTAVLLATAVVLKENQEQVLGTVKLFFQPAEEGPGGGLPMVEAGVMDNPKVDAVFGLHVFPIAKPGTFSVKRGVASSNSDSATITVIGKGGHGASPEKAIDPVFVSMYVGIGMQSIVSRNVSAMDSAVVSIGAINSGTVANIIPEKAEMRLSIRSFSEDTRKLLNKRITEIAEGVSSSMGASCKIDYKFGYPMMFNNDKAVDYLINTLGKEKVIEADKPLSGSEDFSYFLQKAPGAFFGLNAGRDEENYYNHHPKFNPDDSSIEHGIQAFVDIVMNQENLNLKTD